MRLETSNDEEDVAENDEKKMVQVPKAIMLSLFFSFSWFADTNLVDLLERIWNNVED